MMQFSVKTLVEQPIARVFAGFDQSLFLKLAPPFPPVKLLRFDGCAPQDQVHLRLSFIFFAQTWESLITAQHQDANEIYFIDEGVKLPFFLKKWRHKHRIVQQDAQSSWIIDEISFDTPFWLPRWLLFPSLYAMFAYRKPIYRRYFASKKAS